MQIIDFILNNNWAQNYYKEKMSSENPILN